MSWEKAKVDRLVPIQIYDHQSQQGPVLLGLVQILYFL